MKRALCLLAFISALTITACHDNKDTAAKETANGAIIPPPAVMNNNVLKIYPHDTTSFTEGLEWHDNSLYESSGDPDYTGNSRLTRTNLQTGKILQQVDLEEFFFAEGITRLNNKIYQLTYQEHKAFVYDLDFKKLREMEWPLEGWGMTNDGKQLIISIGDSCLYFVNSETFKIERTLAITDNNGYVSNLNELEYVNGYIYANIWKSDYIIKINSKTGVVEAKADLSQILEKNNQVRTPATDVLNGIAYNSSSGSFYITGKNWPAIFEVKFN